MASVKDLTGKVSGMLTVVSQADNRGRRVMWNCLCECGGTITVAGNNLRGRPTQSCGCYKGKLGGASVGREREYHIWYNMVQRCHNPQHSSYPDWGGRGITVCEEWRDDVLAFLSWLDTSNYAGDLTIERRENDQGYGPDNCYFATYKAQNNNQRSNLSVIWQGEEMSLMQAVERFSNAPYPTANWRLRQGWSIDRVLHPLKSILQEKRH